MMSIESILKQFVLLSTISFVVAQPSFALGSAANAAAATDMSVSIENTQTVSIPKAKRHLGARHKKSNLQNSEFVNNFSVPFLPAITD